MLKLHIVVYKNFADIQEALSSKLDRSYQRLFVMFDMVDGKENGKMMFEEYTAEPKSQDSVTIFVKHDLSSKNIGLLEFYIFKATGMRGENIKVDSIEVFEKPNTPLKKYLVRKL
ncbi:hypothetical protein vBSflM004_115 [Shigella phage vB_SflM_004]|nr:hypothetical protein vBSflM004_115 [Shigella phage vB_SflM_004]